jgi:hypothetical protein
MALEASRASISFFLNLSSARSRASFEGVANAVFLIYSIKSYAIDDLTPDAGPVIHVLPQLWQKKLLRPIAKMLDSGTARRQSYAQQSNRAGL